MVLKAFFYLSDTSAATAASVSLDVGYSDGGVGEGFGFVEFGESSADGLDGLPGRWTQGIVAAYPTRVISSARVSEGTEGRGKETRRGGCGRAAGLLLSHDHLQYLPSPLGLLDNLLHHVHVHANVCMQRLVTSGEGILFGDGRCCLCGRCAVRAPRRRLPLRSRVLPRRRFRPGESCLISSNHVSSCLTMVYTSAR